MRYLAIVGLLLGTAIGAGCGERHPEPAEPTGETDDGLGFTAARHPATGITVWTATSQHVARSVMAGSRGGRVYTFGSTPDGVFLDAYSIQGK